MTPSNTTVVDKSFIKIYRGIGYYARLKLQLIQGTGMEGLEVFVRESIQFFGHWELLIREGILQGIRYLQLHGNPPTSGRIEIIELLGPFVDTTDDALVCVGFMAVCELLDPACLLPPLSADRPWRFQME